MAHTLIEYAHLPRIDRAEVRLLWHHGFRDGPTSGLCLFRDHKVWFEMCAEGDEGDGFYRRFLVLELGKDQLDEEEHWHDLFRRKVGTHCDYDPTGEVRPRESWHEFYDEYAKRGRVDYTANSALGWFEEALQ
jgi:hypothetical protein